MSGSNRVAAGIFSSRVVGLVREILIGGVLGRSTTAEAFRVSMRVPNMIQNLLGEGAISASFVPVYAGLVEDDKEEDQNRLAASILGHLAALVAFLVILTIVLARPLVWLVTLGNWTGQRYEWAIELTRITAAGAGLLVLASLCLGILNSHRQYFLPYAAPMLWSGAQIVVLLGILFLTDSDAVEISRTARTWLAGATVAGAGLQLGVQLPAVRRLVKDFRPRLDRDANVSEVFTRFVPALIARGVVQLSSFVDLALASFLAAGAVATLGMVTPLYLISIGVFGFSVATSELTEISRSGLLDSAIARRIRIGIRKVLLPTGLVAPILIVGSPIVIDGLYGWLSRLINFSNLNEAGLAVTALTLTAFALGLPAAMQARVSQNALFALGDVKGPARISVVRLVIVAVVGFVLMLQLDHLAIDSGPADATTADAIVAYETAQADVLDSLGVTARTTDRFDTLVELDEFPHWPLWEPLPSDVREGLGPSGLAPLGPVGLGLASAVASWVEFFLLRRRLRHGVFTPIQSGIVINVLAGASVVAVVTLAFRLFVSNLPSPLPMVLLGPAALVAYIATLTLLGMGPYAGPPENGSDPSVAGEA
ncbi:MAG: lipid II flippase MurJ [Acidimicrobiales bacterium]